MAETNAKRTHTGPRQKGMLGGRFSFRVGGDHFRGGRERGGSAVSSGRLSLGGPREAPEAGGRAGMAAAAAGAGAGTAQEKQFPPALLSFFIYNPRFGPREGEVRGAVPWAGASRRSEEGRRAGAVAGRPASEPEKAGGGARPGEGGGGYRAAPVTPLPGGFFRGCFVPGVRPRNEWGPGTVSGRRLGRLITPRRVSEFPRFCANPG